MFIFLIWIEWIKGLNKNEFLIDFRLIEYARQT